MLSRANKYNLEEIMIGLLLMTTIFMLLITPYAYSSPTLLGFGVPTERGNFVNSIQYETLTQNLGNLNRMIFNFFILLSMHIMDNTYLYVFFIT